MGFTEVKNKVIQCLKSGNYDYEARKDIDLKNVFLVGLLSKEDLIEIIKVSNGKQYESSPHHLDSSIEVHILKPIKDNKRWYIKFYFLEPNVLFISVHES